MKAKAKKKGWKKVSQMIPTIDPTKQKVIEGKLVDIRKVGKFGSFLYLFSEAGTKDSTPKFGIWGSANLDPQLSQVAAGNDVRIEYKGLVKTAQGRKVKTFEVFWR